MLLRLSKRLLVCTCLYTVPSVLNAQVNFIVPSDSVVDYSHYDRIETCMAMKRRMGKQVANKRDSIAYKSQIFVSRSVDTVEHLLVWSVRECVKKFEVESIAGHDSVSRGKKSILAFAMELFYVGKYYDRFFYLTDSVMNNIEAKDTMYMAYVTAFSPISNAITSISPVDYNLYDSLQDKYVLQKLIQNKKDMSAYSIYAQVMYDRIDRMYDDSLEIDRDAYVKFASMIADDLDAHLAYSDTSVEATRVKNLLRKAYDKIYYFSSLDSLRKNGPDSYFNSLKVNHTLAGFNNNRTFLNGVTQKMFHPLAFKAFRYGGNEWNAGKLENIEYPLVTSGQPHLVMSLNVICRNERFHRVPEPWQRGPRTYECWDQYELIKWVKKHYPDIRISIITSTQGHVVHSAFKDPTEEAELIKQAWWGYHKLPADIVIYYTEYFIMPGLDKRRQDHPGENILRYQELIGNSRMAQILPTLLAPDGRIVTTFPLGYSAIKYAKEILDPFYAWYKSTK